MGVISTTLRKPQVNMDSVEAQFVRDAIAKNKVAIFSKTYCPYCTMAKEVMTKNRHSLINCWHPNINFQPFRKLNINAFIIELDGRKDGNEIQSVLGEMTGARTVSGTGYIAINLKKGTNCFFINETGASSIYWWKICRRRYGYKAHVWNGRTAEILSIRLNRTFYTLTIKENCKLFYFSQIMILSLYNNTFVRKCVTMSFTYINTSKIKFHVRREFKFSKVNGWSWVSQVKNDRRVR